MAEIEKENITQNGVYYVYMYRMGVRVSIHYYQFPWKTKKQYRQKSALVHKSL